MVSKTNWQDPASTEIRSPHISGLQEAVGKIEDAIQMKTKVLTGVALSEVYISGTDRYRIYQASAGSRNWVSSPAPVIKKNAAVISTGFEVDYGGGAVIFNPPVLGTDVITADVTALDNMVGDINIHDASRRIKRPSAASLMLLLENTIDELHLASKLRVNSCGNAYYDGTNWMRYDITKSAVILQVDGASGRATIYTAPAGANPITWNGPYDIWHASNDGAGSGLDADLLDGLHASAFQPTLGYTPVNKAGDTMTGLLTLSGDPTTALQAATKQYTDTKVPFAVKASIDLNTLTTPGLYSCQDNCTNKPVAEWGSLIVSYISHPLWGQQLWLGQAGHAYIRRSYDSSGVAVWEPWCKIWDSGNDGAGSGLDADMLDGLHASAFETPAGAQAKVDIYAATYTYGKLVGEIAVGANTTSVQFTGLDANAHGGYIIVAECIPTTGQDVLRVGVNGDGVPSNYQRQHVQFHTAASAGITADNFIMEISANSAGSFGCINVNLSPSGIAFATAQSVSSNDGNSIVQYNNVVRRIVGVANITSIELSAAIASNIKAGSRFRLYRRR